MNDDGYIERLWQEQSPRGHSGAIGWIVGAAVVIAALAYLVAGYL